MTEDRNFRTYYYGKVGCFGVEEKKSLEMLLNDDPQDLQKLSQFCLRFTLPSVYRTRVWKILLGVDARSKKGVDFVRKQRREHFELLKSSLRTMKKINQETRRSHMLTMMYFLERGVQLADITVQPEAEVIQMIAQTVCNLYDCDCDSYWVLRNLCKMLLDDESTTTSIMTKFNSIIAKEDATLQQHLHKIDAFGNLPLRDWYCRAFVGSFPTSCLVRIWDKLIAKSSVIPFVVVSLFLTMKEQILSEDDPKNILNILSQVSEEMGDVIITKAVELNIKYGGAQHGDGRWKL